MKKLDVLAAVLTVVGALNWALVAVARFDLVAALFGLHPLHVESVAWLAERRDVLSVFFALLTITVAVWQLRRTLTA